jgi:predicted dienelactone hydrolase
MRTFELLLWFAASCAVLIEIAGPDRRRVSGIFAAMLIPMAALHLATEGWRVHMIPTYVIAAGLVLVPAVRWRSGTSAVRSTRRRRLLIGSPVFGLTLVALVLPSLFPVYAYDVPSGPYAIGTSVYELDDHARERDLVVQVWYPAARATGSPAGVTSRPDLLAGAFASFTGLPAPLFDNLRLIRTHAIANLPLAPDRSTFPVVLVSHGPGVGNRSQSVFQLEALASHGFIAVAIDHTRYASTTIFPDGRAIPFDPTVGWPTFVDAQSTAMLQTWAADASFVIDQLERLNQDDSTALLTGRLDLSRLGYLGTSFGGSVVVQTLLQDPRIKAGVAEDGKPYFLEEALSALDRPLMYMQSAAPYIHATDAQLAKWGLTARRFREAEQDHYARQMLLFSHAQGPIYNVYIRGTNHVTFSDFYLAVRVPDSELISVRRAHRIINDYTVAFFNRYLNGSPESLVDGTTPSPDPEVTVASRHAGSPHSAAAGR